MYNRGELSGSLLLPDPGLRRQEEAPLYGHIQLLRNPAVEMFLHKGPEIIRMIFRKQLSFPVQTLIHMEDGHVL